MSEHTITFDRGAGSNLPHVIRVVIDPETPDAIDIEIAAEPDRPASLFEVLRVITDSVDALGKSGVRIQTL